MESSQKNKEVCIILVNYNGYEDTVECVKSILKCNYSAYHIILVDNASKDRELLKKDQFLNESCDILYSDVNNGFSEGNNIGIEASKKYNPDYVLLLNNDTIVKDDFLDKLVNAAEKDEKAMIVTGGINYYYDQNEPWYNHGSYHKTTGYTTMVKKDISHYQNPYSVTYSTGCLMLIRFTFIEKYGLLSDDFFLYSEDTEYCLRVLDHNYHILNIPEVLIYHKVNASTGTGSKMQQYYLIRNYLIVARRYNKFSRFIIAYIFRFILSIYEILRYGYDFKIVKLAFSDFRKGLTGKVDYFG